MTGQKLPRHGWVVVCDGAKALFLRNEGDEVYPNLKTEKVLDEPAPANRDIASDRPGRVHESATHGRSAMEETDRHDEAETAFLTTVASELSTLKEKRGITHLVVVAPPKALGVLRSKLSPAVQQIVSAEVAKDLVKFPVHEIETKLTA